MRFSKIVLPDLDGALEFLTKQSYRRFILIGHSLGAIKSIIYQGTRRRTGHRRHRILFRTTAILLRARRRANRGFSEAD